MFNQRPFYRSTRGMYFGSSGVVALLAAAHTSLQGFLWLLNPVANAPIKIAPSRIEFKYSCIAAAAANTRLTVERITFTGVSSAAAIVGLPRRSAEPAQTANLVAATTGITPATVSANAPAYTSFAPTVVTAAGILVPTSDVWLPGSEDGMFILLPGEGIVVRQPDVGVATDPRVVAISVEWEEFQ